MDVSLEEVEEGQLVAPTAPGVIFTNWEDFHEHHKSEWHRYNLKRRIASLPYITKDVFDRKAAEQLALIAKASRNTKGAESEKRWYCEVSNKSFKTKNAYDNYRQSKQFKKKEEEYKAQIEAAAALPGPSTAKPKPMAIEDKKDSGPFKSEFITRLVGDMRGIYGPGFLAGDPMTALITDDGRGSDDFTPEADMTKDEYDVAQESIREVLGRVVKWAPTWDLFSNKRFATVEENLEHMGKAYSFFIPDREYCTDIEGLIVYCGEKISAGFSLYTNKLTKSARAARDQMVSKGETKINWDGNAPLEFEKYYDYRSSYPDYVEGETAPDGALAVPLQYQNTTKSIADDNEFELALPGGQKAGHRSLKRYYKQHFQPHSDRKSLAINKSAAEYQEMGLSTFVLSNEERKADKTKKVWERHAKKIHLRDGIQNNKQKHFRRQYLNAG